MHVVGLAALAITALAAGWRSYVAMADDVGATETARPHTARSQKE